MPKSVFQKKEFIEFLEGMYENEDSHGLVQNRYFGPTMGGVKQTQEVLTFSSPNPDGKRQDINLVYIPDGIFDPYGAAKRFKVPGIIYLLHFDKPFHHAQHYIGWTEKDLPKRLERHKKGRGSRLMRAVVAAGINFELADAFHGTRFDERKLKNKKNARRFCPICKGESKK